MKHGGSQDANFPIYFSALIRINRLADQMLPPRDQNMHSKQLRMNKACELEDFADENLLRIMRSIAPVHSCDNRWPHGSEDRKFWEIAMAVNAMHRCLPPERRRVALGIGAGTEATSYVLTNYFDWVIATDLYGNGWDQDAPAMMLQDPIRFADDIPCRPGRLLPQYMDGRNLRFEDGSFDFIYSCSSIEHFGETQDITDAMREMSRVLRPGGIIALSTEIEVSGKGGRLNQSTLLLSADQIHDLIITSSECIPIDFPDYRVSDQTTSRCTKFSDAMKDLPRMRHRLKDRWSHYPHVVLSDHTFRWTSAQVVLRKPRGN